MKSPIREGSLSTEAQPPLGFFISNTMRKRRPVLPKSKEPQVELQLERQRLKAMLFGDKMIPFGFTRGECVTRLREVERELNRIYNNQV